MIIGALPYLSTTPSIIAAVQYMNKLHAGPSASEAAQKNIPRTPVRGDSCWKTSELFSLLFELFDLLNKLVDSRGISENRGIIVPILSNLQLERLVEFFLVLL